MCQIGLLWTLYHTSRGNGIFNVIKFVFADTFVLIIYIYFIYSIKYLCIFFFILKTNTHPRFSRESHFLFVFCAESVYNKEQIADNIHEEVYFYYVSD